MELYNDLDRVTTMDLHADFDYQAFAKLRGGGDCDKASLKWGILVSGILFLSGFFLLLSQNGWAVSGF